MKISELSSRSGVAVATVKFYLREGLLAAGEKSSQTQASYDESHVARLRLIRAFIEVGGLSVASARDVLAVIDDENLPFGVAVGIAAAALPGGPASVVPSESSDPQRGQRDLAALVAERGWTVDPVNPGWALAARVIDDYAALGREDLLTTLPVYAQAAELIAAADLQTVADSRDRAQMTETVVVGTVLGDSLFAGLRRMAHENVSRTVFPVPPEIAAAHGHTASSTTNPSTTTPKETS
ncbi:MAG: MerR family transcriptional regulator [Pseudolysinimonas sp.]